MKYTGKLYGKIGKKYFDTGFTSEDYDKLQNENSELKKQVLNLPVVRHSTRPNIVNETLKQTQLDQDIKTRTAVFGMFESGDDINVSLIQRKCSVGYFSATRVLENLINDGFVEPQKNGKGLNKFA